MKSKEEYEKLLRHIITPGDVVRVKLTSERAFNSQRMVIYRLLKQLKEEGIDLYKHITIAKEKESITTYLVISYLIPDTEFEFLQKDGTFSKVDIEKDSELLTGEEEEFLRWQRGVEDKS